MTERCAASSRGVGLGGSQLLGAIGLSHHLNESRRSGTRRGGCLRIRMGGVWYLRDRISAPSSHAMNNHSITFVLFCQRRAREMWTSIVSLGASTFRRGWWRWSTLDTIRAMDSQINAIIFEPFRESLLIATWVSLFVANVGGANVLQKRAEEAGKLVLLCLFLLLGFGVLGLAALRPRSLQRFRVGSGSGGSRSFLDLFHFLGPGNLVLDSRWAAGLRS